MIGFGELLVVSAVTVGLIGFAVFKSRRVRIAIGVMMAITVIRALFFV